MTCIRVAAAVEGWPPRGPRPEQTIKEKESNAEVLVHEPFVVESPVMDVVSFPGGDKPAPEAGIALHPEIVDVHPIVKITEHEEAPSQRSGDENGLMHEGHVQKMKDADGYRQKERTWHDPFQADVAERDGFASGVVIAGAGTLGVKRPVQDQMVSHVTATQEADLAAVQKPMQQVTEKFRSQDRRGHPEQDCECAFHERKVRRLSSRDQATCSVRSALSQDDGLTFQGLKV